MMVQTNYSLFRESTELTPNSSLFLLRETGREGRTKTKHEQITLATVFPIFLSLLFYLQPKHR